MKKRNQLYRSFRAMSAATPFAFREAYKSLRTNLNFVSLNNQYKTIGITSAVPGEGKSSVAIHLATSLAEAGHKVLLADCDLRRPRIHKYLKIVPLGYIQKIPLSAFCSFQPHYPEPLLSLAYLAFLLKFEFFLVPIFHLQSDGAKDHVK